MSAFRKLSRAAHLLLLGEDARAKPCKGMMGLVEEGQEVMKKGENKEDAMADLALIGAAQRVEHYEISGYTTAKNLASQLRHSAIVSLATELLVVCDFAGSRDKGTPPKRRPSSSS